MTNPQTIEFVIKSDGTVEETVQGITGPHCEAVTKAIEDALGQVEERQHTGDYYGQATESGEFVTTGDQ